MLSSVSRGCLTTWPRTGKHQYLSSSQDPPRTSNPPSRSHNTSRASLTSASSACSTSSTSTHISSTTLPPPSLTLPRRSSSSATLLGQCQCTSPHPKEGEQARRSVRLVCRPRGAIAPTDLSVSHPQRGEPKARREPAEVLDREGRWSGMKRTTPVVNTKSSVKHYSKGSLE
jgi:hypothetical protein